MQTSGTRQLRQGPWGMTVQRRHSDASGRPAGLKGNQAIFLPRVRGTTIGSWEEQYFPLL